MQNFIKAEFKVKDILVKDQLIAVLTFYNYEGFEETEDGLSAYIKEEDFEELFEGSVFDESKAAISNLMEKNPTLTKKIKSIKREQEDHSVRMCEVLE